MLCPGAASGPFDIYHLMQSFVALESTASRFARFYVKAGGDPVQER
jgi:hypothetical protein